MAALLWWLSVISSFLPSQTLNSWEGTTIWKREPRKGLEVYLAQGLSHIFVVKRACCLLRSPSEPLRTAVVTELFKNWAQEVAHLSDIKRPAMEEKQKHHRWSCFSNPEGCPEISRFPLCRPQRLPSQLFIS